MNSFQLALRSRNPMLKRIREKFRATTECNSRRVFLFTSISFSCYIYHNVVGFPALALSAIIVASSLYCRFLFYTLSFSTFLGFSSRIPLNYTHNNMSSPPIRYIRKSFAIFAVPVSSLREGDVGRVFFFVFREIELCVRDRGKRKLTCLT